jgi:hypothetical protein
MMFKNVSGQKITLFALDVVTKLPKTGDAANLTAYVQKDDGSVTVLTDTSATQLDATNAPGLYVFDLTQAETNANKLVFSGKSSTADVVVMPAVMYTVPPNFTDLSIDTGKVNANVTEFNGDTVEMSATPGVINVNTQYINDGAGVIGLNTLGSDYQGAGKVSSHVLTVADDAITEDALAISASADIAAAVWAATTRVLTAGTNLALLDAAGVRTAVGLGSANLDTQLSGLNTSIATAAGYIDTEVSAIKVVTDKLDTAVELDGSVYRFTINALEQAPVGGGGGETDWTADERTAIRSILGIPGSGTTPADPSTGILDTIRDSSVAIKAKTDNLPSDPADASDISSAMSAISASLVTLATYVDTEVSAIKAKTDNLPSDPADASDIAASFASIAATLSTMAGYIDTEVSAIKAKTDNLPSDPADASDISTSIASLTAYVDTEVAAIKAQTDKLTFDGSNRISSIVADKTGFKLASDGVDSIVTLSGCNLRQAVALLLFMRGNTGSSFDPEGDCTVVVTAPTINSPGTISFTMTIDASKNVTGAALTPPT